MRLVVVEEQALVEMIQRAVRDVLAARPADALAPAMVAQPPNTPVTAEAPRIRPGHLVPDVQSAEDDDPCFPQHPDVAEWHIYLSNGQRAAEVAYDAAWRHVLDAITATLGPVAGDWSFTALPRYVFEESAREEGAQRFTLYAPENAVPAPLDVSPVESPVAPQRNLLAARRAWARRVRSAAAAPSPTAFFAPVPDGVAAWRLYVRDAEAAQVHAEATLVEVASAVHAMLSDTPITVTAIPVAPQVDDFDTGLHRRVFNLTLEDAAPPRFAPMVSRPWLSIEAAPWLPPTRVPAYSTRREVVMHICAVAASEWLDEIRAHGLTLNVQPLDALLLPVDDVFTISLFPPEFR